MNAKLKDWLIQNLIPESIRIRIVVQFLMISTAGTEKGMDITLKELIRRTQHGETNFQKMTDAWESGETFQITVGREGDNV